MQMSRMILTKPAQRKIYLAVVLLVSLFLVFFAILGPYLLSASDNILRIGDVAQQDIRAPYVLTYESQEQTEHQREVAVNSAPPVYTSLDTAVARRQLEHLRSALAFITTIRSDIYATPEQKMADFAGLQEVQLTPETVRKIIDMSPVRWQAVQQESILVLEEIMRSVIRENRLGEARKNVPALVSLSLPEESVGIVVELVDAFVAPNSFLDPAQTEATRQQIRDAVLPVTRTFAKGETIVQSGEVISSSIYEALQAFNLTQNQENWRQIVSAAILTFLVHTFFIVYLRYNTRLLNNLRGLTVIAILFWTFLLGARFILPGHIVLPYLYPIVAFSLILAILFRREAAIVFTIPLAILAAYQLPMALDLTLYYLMGGFFGVMALRNAQRVMSFFWAGIAASVSGAAVVFLFRVTDPANDWIGILTLVGAALACGIVSAGISLIFQFFIAQFLGLTTSMQLIELSRPDRPLLQYLLRRAPGTYQHSLQVSNLAEQAAERIGADTLLTRVGALYHDIGKALNPLFFIENQPPGEVNPHNDISPLASSATVIRHVSDGLELARHYRLPQRLRDFISEHHGTTVTRYQYSKAVEAAGGDPGLIDEEKFRYPGPRPQSRETALLMLADSCEARVRAERPHDETELRRIIQSSLDDRVKQGELNETDLTLRELDAIVESFVATLRGIFHPRIEYPEMQSAAASADPDPSQAISEDSLDDKIDIPTVPVVIHSDK
jgi:putative nucleotidyltransferase with HDIG domain